jgi:hypothetical protein
MNPNSSENTGDNQRNLRPRKRKIEDIDDEESNDLDTNRRRQRKNTPESLPRTPKKTQRNRGITAGSIRSPSSPFESLNKIGLPTPGTTTERTRQFISSPGNIHQQLFRSETPMELSYPSNEGMALPQGMNMSTPYSTIEGNYLISPDSYASFTQQVPPHSIQSPLQTPFNYFPTTTPRTWSHSPKSESIRNLEYPRQLNYNDSTNTFNDSSGLALLASTAVQPYPFTNTQFSEQQGVFSYPVIPSDEGTSFPYNPERALNIPMNPMISNSGNPLDVSEQIPPQPTQRRRKRKPRRRTPTPSIRTSRSPEAIQRNLPITPSRLRNTWIPRSESSSMNSRNNSQESAEGNLEGMVIEGSSGITNFEAPVQEFSDLSLVEEYLDNEGIYIDPGVDDDISEG